MTSVAGFLLEPWVEQNTSAASKVRKVSEGNNLIHFSSLKGVQPSSHCVAPYKTR